MRLLVTGKQAAQIDRYTIEEIGVPQLVLMERAALAVAEEAEAIASDKKNDRILVVAESGNNGGDGVAAARILHQRGYRVAVWALNGISKATEAYKKQVELAEKAGVEFIPGDVVWDLAEHSLDSVSGAGYGSSTSLAGYRIIIDAVFGVGLTREVKEIQKEAVERINAARQSASEMTVIAVDIPSGISSESGEVLGTAVKADRTVTFGYEKVGMRFAKGYSGTVKTVEIGFYLPDGEMEGRYFGYEPSDLCKELTKRAPEGNKGSFGHVLVVAGSKDMCGAAFFAAEAAYRTGCGLVKVVTHESNRAALQQMLPEAILQCYESTSDVLREEDLKWASAVIIGPGIGQSEMALSLTKDVLLHAKCPVIVDADAINLLSEHMELLEETAGRRPLILTPHMLEMTRLVEKNLHPEREALVRLTRNRLDIAEKTAEAYQATVVLKDACTVVTEGRRAPEGKSERPGYLNTSGNEAMAKGGSGDVLTGVIAGLIAQGKEPEEAARLGVYIHGLAGDLAKERLGTFGVMARDLMDEIPKVLQCRS